MRHRSLRGAAGVVPAHAEEAGPLHFEATIPLGDVRGRIDHMAVDLARRRLFVAELGNDTVSVVDLEAREVVKRLSGLHDPQGVAYLPATDTLYVANGGDGTLRLFHGPQYDEDGSIALGDDADNVRIDPLTRLVLVGYGRGGIAVIDPFARTKIGDIPPHAHPESFQIDAGMGRAFANVPNAHRIGVLDPECGQQVASWATGGLSSNFPMALDGEAKRVLVMFRSPPKLGVYPALQDGSPLATADACADADDIFADAKHRLIYVSCGAGVIDVFDAQTYRLSGKIPTAAGARTSLYVPEFDRFQPRRASRQRQSGSDLDFSVGAVKVNRMRPYKVAILWRGDRATRAAATSQNNRYRRIFEELDALGIHTEPAIYADDMVNEVREQLLGMDGVLVWVNPIDEGRTREKLDPLLREVASKGTWVSAHPDVILKMGVKEVLHRTKHLGWGSDTHLYRTAVEFRDAFPLRLQSGGPRVLKQNRGNGGQGVWKVEGTARPGSLSRYRFHAGGVQCDARGTHACGIYGALRGLLCLGRMCDRPAVSATPAGRHDPLLHGSRSSCWFRAPVHTSAHAAAPQGSELVGPAHHAWSRCGPFSDAPNENGNRVDAADDANSGHWRLRSPHHLGC